MTERPTLDTWGEIASYLGCSVRTAQRWERERGLPVHRIQGQTASWATIYARPDEIDAWRAARDAPAPGRGVPARGFGMRGTPAALGVGIALVLIGLLAGAVLWPAPPVAPAPAVEFLAYETAGRIGIDYWLELSSGAHEPIDTWRFDNHVAVAALAEIHGRKRILVGLGGGPGARRGWLLALRPDGSEDWHFDTYDAALMSELERRHQDRSGYLRVTSAFVFEIDGRAIVAVIASDPQWFATRVTLLDGDTGEHLASYWHSGRLDNRQAIAGDIDADGVPEIITPGYNNAAWGQLAPWQADTPVVLAIDLPQLLGWGSAQSWPPRWGSLPVRIPKWYFLIPVGPETDLGVESVELDDRSMDGVDDVLVRTGSGRFYSIAGDGTVLAVDRAHHWQRQFGLDTPVPALRPITDLDVAAHDCLHGHPAAGLARLESIDAHAELDPERAELWRRRCRALGARETWGDLALRLRQVWDAPPFVEDLGPLAAAGAGPQAGDVIVSIGDAPVATGADLLYEVRRRPPGSAVELTVRRGGRELAAPMRLRAFVPDDAAPGG